MPTTTPKDQIAEFVQQVEDYKNARKEFEKQLKAQRKALKKAADDWEPLQKNETWLVLVSDEDAQDLQAAYRSARQLTKDSKSDS